MIDINVNTDCLVSVAEVEVERRHFQLLPSRAQEMLLLASFKILESSPGYWIYSPHNVFKYG